MPGTGAGTDLGSLKMQKVLSTPEPALQASPPYLSETGFLTEIRGGPFGYTGWPVSPKDPPASASLVPGVQVCASIGAGGHVCTHDNLYTHKSFSQFILLTLFPVFNILAGVGGWGGEAPRFS